MPPYYYLGLNKIQAAIILFLILEFWIVLFVILKQKIGRHRAMSVYFVSLAALVFPILTVVGIRKGDRAMTAGGVILAILHLLGAYYSFLKYKKEKRKL